MVGSHGDLSQVDAGCTPCPPCTAGSCSVLTAYACKPTTTCLHKDTAPCQYVQEVEDSLGWACKYPLLSTTPCCYHLAAPTLHQCHAGVAWLIDAFMSVGRAAKNGLVWLGAGTGWHWAQGAVSHASRLGVITTTDSRTLH
jgi:hypothetical protein